MESQLTMSQIICRLCANVCKSKNYKMLYDDFEVYDITTKFFDPMFLNVKHWLTAVCLDCWYHMIDFHTFQEKFVVTQKQFGGFVSQERICRFCAKKCREKEFKKLNGYMEMFKIVAKYVDLKFLKDIIIGICVQCCNTIMEFHKFQEFVLKGQHKFGKNEEPEYTNDQFVSPCDDNSNITVTNDDKDMHGTKYTIIMKSDESEYQSHNSIVIKEEPELELIDVHSDSQYSYSQEESFRDRNISQFDNQSTERGDIHMDYNNDSSMEDDDDYDPLQLSNERRKTIPELDGIIAQWRPLLECILCGVTCATFTLLQKHFEVVHPNKKCYITCCQCNLKTHYYIEEHIRFHIDPNIFKCQICGQGNTTRLRLKRHVDYWHSGASKSRSSETEINKLMCSECGKTPKTIGAYRKHMHRHKAKRKFKCEICDKGFRGRSDLRSHLATHADNKCPDCSMRFKNITRLRAHQASEHAD